MFLPWNILADKVQAIQGLNYFEAGLRWGNDFVYMTA